MAEKNVNAWRIRFDGDLDAVLRIMSDARLLYVRRADGHFNRIGSRQMEDLAAFALLRVHLAWEDFLENTFLRYMCGARAGSGMTPALLRARQATLSGAMLELLDGDRYLLWSYSDAVTRAGRYFDRGDPYSTPLAAIRSSLEAIPTIRNAIAHRSQAARARFRQLVIAERGYMPRGMTPGRFLLDGSPKSYLNHYVDELSVAASLICP